MEFWLPLHPKNTATLLDNSTHWLRSAIQFKWSIAEHEIYRIRTVLIGESRDERGYISRDVKDLWKARKSKDVRSYENELSNVKIAYDRIVDDRNTIIHGNLDILPQIDEFYVPDLRASATSGFIPFYRPGRVVMVREEKEVSQNAVVLREINEKADQLLFAIYAMWIAMDPRYGVEVNRRIDSASSPDIGFGPNGEKTARFTGRFNLRDILNLEGTSHYICKICDQTYIANPSQEPVCCNVQMVKLIWKECPECDIVAIENGPSCWHMAMADYYENGVSRTFTVRLSIEYLIEQLNQVGADNLVLEFSPATGKLQLIWEKSEI